MRDDAQQAHATTLNALSALPPPPPEHPAVELLRLLTVFATETKSWIDGAEQHEGLIQIWKAASARFKGKILHTAPNFRPFKNAEEELRLTPAVKYVKPEEEQGMASEDESYDNLTKNANMSPPVFLLEVRKEVRKWGLVYQRQFLPLIVMQLHRPWTALQCAL